MERVFTVSAAIGGFAFWISYNLMPQVQWLRFPLIVVTACYLLSAPFIAFTTCWQEPRVRLLLVSCGFGGAVALPLQLFGHFGFSRGIPMVQFFLMVFSLAFCTYLLLDAFEIKYFKTDCSLGKSVLD